MSVSIKASTCYKRKGIKLCKKGQNVLDIGTGTGILPRNMYLHGPKWVGTDISENQIKQAKLLSSKTDIDYYVMSAETLNFPKGSFDVITACQCYWYFQQEHIALLAKIAPANFEVLHYAAILELKKSCSNKKTGSNHIQDISHRSCTLIF